MKLLYEDKELFSILETSKETKAKRDALMYKDFKHNKYNKDLEKASNDTLKEKNGEPAKITNTNVEVIQKAWRAKHLSFHPDRFMSNNDGHMYSDKEKQAIKTFERRSNAGKLYGGDKDLLKNSEKLKRHEYKKSHPYEKNMHWAAYGSVATATESVLSEALENIKF